MKQTILFIMLAIAFAGCSSGGDDADGGTTADGAVPGDGGCTTVKACSTKDTAEAVCIRGSCEALSKEQNYVDLNLGFTYATEIMDSVTAYTYFALHPTMVDGGTLQCEDLINGLDPEDSNANLIQKYNKQLIVSGEMMQTATLNLPYMTGMILFMRTLDENDATNGLACTPDVTVSADVIEVGMTFCPADRIDRCLTLLPK